MYSFVQSAPRTCANAQLLARARRLLDCRYASTASNSPAQSQITHNHTDNATPPPPSSSLSSSTASKPQDNPFEPRASFPSLPSLPRSYFLGHHAAGLDRMRALLTQVDLVIECRDARVPFTGRNPLLERTLSDAGTARRIVCYTKRDLVTAADTTPSRAASTRERLLRQWHARPGRTASGTEVVCFSSAARLVHGRLRDEGIVGKEVMSALRRIARDRWSLTGLRVLVAGMPNVGKSTLLNALRARGVKKGKAARTGADPGVTRKVSGWVKVLEGWEVDAGLPGSSDASAAVSAEERRAKSQSEGVYVCDSPGVFMPYVPSSEAMLKLALVGAVKDDSAIIHPVTLADYLLFHLNLDAAARELYCRMFAPSREGPPLQPTNDIMALLDAAARRTGRIGRGGKPDMEGTATWLVKKWRRGDLGRFGLDEVSERVLADMASEEDDEDQGPVSISQAKRMEKERRKERGRARYAAKMGLAAE